MPLRIENRRLAVDIALPGEAYRRSRFDWTAFITQVTLDGRHTFCVTEGLAGVVGNTGGIGLCNEFGIRGALGYDDAVPGQEFVKLGVGLLTRDSARPYFFAHEYRIRPFPISHRVERDRVTFTIEPLACRGIAARLEKTVRIAGDRLSLEYRLDNVGSRPISTDEYCHNFIAIDGHPTGPANRLRTSFTLAPRTSNEAFTANGASIRWPQTPDRFFHCQIDGFGVGPSWWMLSHDPSGICVRERTDCAWSSFALYGTPRLISPEAFVAVDVAPGATRCWRREYRFWQRASGKALVGAARGEARRNG